MLDWLMWLSIPNVNAEWENPGEEMRREDENEAQLEQLKATIHSLITLNSIYPNTNKTWDDIRYHTDIDIRNSAAVKSSDTCTLYNVAF